MTKLWSFARFSFIIFWNMISIKPCISLTLPSFTFSSLKIFHCSFEDTHLLLVLEGTFPNDLRRQTSFSQIGHSRWGSSYLIHHHIASTKSYMTSNVRHRVRGWGDKIQEQPQEAISGVRLRDERLSLVIQSLSASCFTFRLAKFALKMSTACKKMKLSVTALERDHLSSLADDCLYDIFSRLGQ